MREQFVELTSAILGRDLITGRPLSSFEKTLILVGVAAGVLTFGLGDEAIDLGADLLRHMDDIDAGGVVKAGRGLGHVDEATDAVRAENRLAREVLVKADIGTGLNRADDAVQTRLRNLVDAPSGDGAVRRGAELRAALSSGSNRRTLSERLDAAAARRKSVFSNQCANSFTAGTPVETEEGQKPIEEIEVGDKVLAQDPDVFVN